MSALDIIPDMKAFEPYVTSLEQLVVALSQGRRNGAWNSLPHALDGQPSAQVRALVDIETLRASGAFFTGSDLRERMVAKFAESIESTSIIVDPACGVGDLLIACANRLPIAATVSKTLQAWGHNLYGSDIHPEFVRAAKIRLVLLANLRHNLPCRTPWDTDKLFPNIKVANGLQDTSALEKCTHLILNPPYQSINTPVECAWSSGKVSAAAVFMDICTKRVPTGARVAALLPDVLRSGTRYPRWRNILTSRLEPCETELIPDRFDGETDIHVYILSGTVSATTTVAVESTSSNLTEIENPRVADNYDVHVGTVVPHRDKENGRLQPYLVTRMITGAKRFNADASPRRGFAKKTFTPPFVAIRRTSRPEQEKRIGGTIIEGQLPVLVENHIIVVKPRSGGLHACAQLIKVLESADSVKWMNHRIRCRHLTASALKDVPWPRGNDDE